MRLGRIHLEKIKCQSFPSIFEAKKGGRKRTEKAKYAKYTVKEVIYQLKEYFNEKVSKLQAELTGLVPRPIAGFHPRDQ